MSESESPKAQARAFLEIAKQYRLGELPTEQSHPWSQNLSKLAIDDLEAGFEVFRKIDLAALDVVSDAVDKIAALASDIADTFGRGGRVFLAGCGATGRLALTVESLCRDGLVPEQFQDSVVGFMAGGDAALIRSLEGFEDRDDYGRRQLEELGFTHKDLMIGITEGGETPFVIAATERAADLSNVPAWFCFCNPETILESVADRSQRILARRDVKRLPLLTGPMALSGSTRLQATTVQLLAIAGALRNFDTPERIAGHVRDIKDVLVNLNYAQMARFTELESKCVKAGGHILYQTDKYGLTVLTDTTERAPTFSLNPFENTQRSDQPNSLVYLSVSKSGESLEAWESILGRRPRTLEWPEVCAEAGLEYLKGYDISENARAHRTERLKRLPDVFSIFDTESGISFSFQGCELELTVPADALIRNLVLKVLLNAHSTLLAGKLGRYEGNWMTWVKPSNRKLIDRAIRYIQQIQEKRGMPERSYDEICHALFETQNTLKADSSVVLETLRYLNER